MTKEEIITKLFFEGVEEFEKGLPIPKNRAKAFGWRHAKMAKTQLELNLDAAIEAFVELDRDLGESLEGDRADKLISPLV